MVEKSHVALTHCFFCGEGNEIVLHKRLGDVSALHGKVMNMRPCGKCEGYMARGVILIGISDEHSDANWQHPGQVEVRDRMGRMTTEHGMPNPFRTGAFMVVSEDFIRRAFNPPDLVANVLRCRWSFIEHQALFQLGLLHHAAEEAGKPYRECACIPCKHHWLHEVKLSPETPNLSGEATPFCPICKKAASEAGPVITPAPKAPEPPTEPEDHSHHVDSHS